MQTAEKSQSPKHDILVAHGGISGRFADGPGQIPRSRSHQLFNSRRTGSKSSGKMTSVTLVKNFPVSIFQNPPNLHKKMLPVQKQSFLTFRARFGSEGGPGDNYQCFQSIQHTISDISTGSSKSSHFSEKVPKNVFGQVSYKTCST